MHSLMTCCQPFRASSGWFGGNSEAAPAMSFVRAKSFVTGSLPRRIQFLEYILGAVTNLTAVRLRIGP